MAENTHRLSTLCTRLFRYHLEHNFQKIPDLVSEFEYLIRPGKILQNPGAFGKFDLQQID